MPNNQDDIINIKYKKSTKYPLMPLEKRAAQFAPFSVLKGFDEAIEKKEKRSGKKA
ncbi:MULTISPECIES: hypothetical protein [Campylobacter]|uniref:hypothetical protein n=1 Tax=Campylobacter TaxID=194 RepID=UPI000A6770B1|nr:MULTISPECIES: hypothetical protein [Campylobacter]